MRPFLCSLILLVSSFLNGQTSFFAVADAEKIRPGNLVEVSFILKNGEGEDFISPDFSNDFYILSGPNRGLSTVIQNGQMQREMSFSYTLQPKRIGKLTIRPARIKVKGKTLKSNSLTILVTSDGKQENNDQDFFIRAELAQNTIYLGQQVRLDYKIYTRKEIQNYSILQESDYGGFYAADIQRMDNMVQTTNIKGKTYYTKILRSVALYPQQTGKQRISPLVLQVGLLEEEDPQRPSSLFFNGDVNYVNVESNVLNVTVKDLPKPVPSNFNGGIGNFSAFGSIDKTSATTNETFYLTITILGDGDAKRIKSPNLNLPPSFQLYDTKSEEEERGENEGKKFSQKSFTYVIQPQKEGEFSFQPSFTYFYPLTGKYETKSLDPFLIKITAGQSNSIPLKTDTDQFVSLSAEDFKTPSIFTNILWIAGFTIPFLGIAFFYLFTYFKQQKKVKSPSEVTTDHLQQAKIFGDQGDYENSFIELSFALRTFLFHQFDIPKENFSNEQIIDKLDQSGLSNQELTQQLRQLLNRFEMVLYAPSMKKDQWKLTWEEVCNWIKQFDKG
ncbi:MAG: BatD family protein [Saprospiraceae bacterium]